MTSPDGRDIQLELLKLLAELTVFCGTIEKPEDKVQQLYNTLIVSIVFHTRLRTRVRNTHTHFNNLFS